MSCPKQEVTGAWRCGMPAGHEGAHLSREQCEALLGALVAVCR